MNSDLQKNLISYCRCEFIRTLTWIPAFAGMAFTYHAAGLISWIGWLGCP